LAWVRETAVKKTGDAHDAAFGEQTKNWRACGGPATLLTRGSRMGVQQNAGRAGRIVAGAGTPDLPPVGRYPSLPRSSTADQGLPAL